MSGFRFHPPAVSLTRELHWVLLRAFGPLEAAAPAGVDLASAVELATRLGVAARIGARARGVAELATAPAATADLAHASAQAAATQLRAREAAHDVAAAGAEAAVGCCFLKGTALADINALLPGGRPIADVDVLVRVDAGDRLGAALVRRGFAAGASEEYPHQLPAFRHPGLGMVEVHRHLPGVAVPPSTRFATFDHLEQAGVIEASPELGPAAKVPARHVVVAHALAHALAQHGWSPSAYPQLRLIADLLDLGIAGEDGEPLLDRALPMIDRWVPAEEVRAAYELCRLLAAGSSLDLASDEPPILLLRHMLAGTLDDRYREALKLDAVAHPLHEGTRLGGRWAALRQAVVLSRSQVDRIYGPQRSRWGYLMWRLLRPFDLARRWLAALRARR
ncbi:MAG TPA: nucleotidyltransferase family protein [Thermoanaerobaculia bacterium]|nr:nucleotidyltransferase family protein [Thermoanaerobaculia bacterium]